ncbi:hypothetical protein [Bifidobacterium longum]|uniref:hypothetical protein n=1 Tax=Bifidobacterium longum TaxID=216816 RepID=UPI000C31549A|nr:hypothetical protein [Bifidobacterium longum]PKC91664.1 hypothetical protein APC1482_0659 [Bifidobacterium longum]
MTQIKFDFGHPSADGIADLAGETVHVVPTSRFNSGKRIVVRDSFEVRLDEHGTATVTVPPTDNTFAYEVTVGESPDAWRFVRCVQVPNSSAPVAFADLTDVDSSTLAPALNNGAALTYLLASSLQEAQSMSAANPGQMVFYPEGKAKTVASQILEDLTGARAVVEAQSAVAAQAANAAQAATAQVTAVADSITESKTVVEAHANDALTAIDEAVKSVQDKASDVSGEDRTDTMPTDSTDSASSQEA